jgi:hypothetical protein
MLLLLCLPQLTFRYAVFVSPQSVRRGSRQFLHRFDYGNECSNSSSSNAGSGILRCNLEVYGQAEPPVYDPAAITTPLALFTGREPVHKMHAK